MVYWEASSDHILLINNDSSRITPLDMIILTAKE